MQFHLNGFRPGDPRLADRDARTDRGANHQADRQSGDQLPAEVDVLIVGCGPAGLTLAAQLAAFPDIKTAIVDLKPERLSLGQADGIACRTMEMFEAFGFSERVMQEGYWVNETTFWKPDAAAPDRIVRTGRIDDTEEGLSEFPHMILNQARVHDFFLDVMAQSPGAIEPFYSRRFSTLSIDRVAQPEYPVTATLERVDPDREGQRETVRARYVVGCDGARSAVRAAIGRELRGDSVNQAWGVMDVLAVTDFPDIRLKTLIQSSTEGSMIVIPREGGYLARLYIEVETLNEDERVSNRNINSDRLIAAARRILHPYSLDVKEVAWWSVYQIGQRLCDKFDDVNEELKTNAAAPTPRVFITGDACHTHSPKAGQGMNVSMRDSFNLGWKLASVIEGRSPSSLLHTYSGERQAVAQELIDFDREWAAVLSAKPQTDAGSDEGGPDEASEFQNYFVKSGRYTAGTEIRYRPSILTGQPTYQHLAAGLEVGMRFHSAPVIRLADAKPMQLGHTVKADGRWRLFVFADQGAGTSSSNRLTGLLDFLAKSSDSPVRTYTPPGADVDAVIDVRAVFQEPHRQLAVEALHPFLLPPKGRYGLLDYQKVFCLDPAPGRDIFALRAIDRQQGCVVIVRPDQHIAHILPLDAHSELSAFFGNFLIDQS
ncbi:MAG: FAD-binding monooxygenase [Acidimicrobiales bacterium]